MDDVHRLPQRTYMMWVQSAHKPGHTPAFQVSHISVLLKGVQHSQLFSVVSAPCSLGVCPSWYQPVHLSNHPESERQPAQRLGPWLGTSPPLCSVCKGMLVDNVTSDLTFAVKGCNWCKCVKIRMRGKEMGSQDSSCSTAALGYPGYTLGAC